jgi:hypothetical protein
LRIHKRISICSSGVGVEESVDVATSNINSRADGLSVLLEGVERLGNGEWTYVTTPCECSLAGRDKFYEIRGRTETVEDRLVTDNTKLDNIPVFKGLV